MTLRTGRVLVLGPESYGGFAGIAQGTRDYLDALSTAPGVEGCKLLARRKPDGGPNAPDYLEEEVCSGSGLRYAWQAWRSARREPFLFVYCLHVNLMPVAAFLRRTLGLRVWLSLHGIDAWCPEAGLRRRAAREVDLVTTSSAWTRDQFLDWAPLSPDRVSVLNNPVHLERWSPGPKPEYLLERYGLRGRKVLLTLGRLPEGHRKKGHDEILDLLPILAAREPRLSWLIAGDGPDRGRLEKKVRSLGLEGRVVFAGRIPEEEKLDHYRVADAFALPSCTEGFGIVYLEAMACGLPALGSTRDGSYDALGGGRLGLCVDPENKAELMDGLLQLLGRPKCVPERIEDSGFPAMRSRLHALLKTEGFVGERRAA